jgi:hypothetical protein
MDIKELKKGQKFLYRAYGSVTVREGTFGGVSPGGYVNVGKGEWVPADQLTVLEALEKRA